MYFSSTTFPNAQAHQKHQHQLSAWPVPHPCAQPYHPSSGSLRRDACFEGAKTLFSCLIALQPNGMCLKERRWFFREDNWCLVNVIFVRGCKGTKYL